MKQDNKGGRPPPPEPAPANARPRAQVAYEGDDEFSVMSTDARRRRKPTVELAPQTHKPGVVETPEEPPKNTAWHFIRRIFGQ